MLKFARRLRRVLLVLVATLLIVLATTTGLARALLPFAEDYRVELQTWISGALAVPVRIAELDITWANMMPAVKLADVRFLPGVPAGDLLADEGDWQVLGDLHARLDLLALLRGDHLPISDLSLVGIKLNVTRNAQGEWLVAGRALTESGDEQPNQMLDRAGEATDEAAGEATADWLGWLLTAPRLGLRHASVALVDEIKGIDYAFNDVNLMLQNDGDRHLISADIELPRRFGQRLQLALDFTAQALELEDIEGSLWLKSEGVNLASMAGLWPQSGIRVRSGRLDLEAWGDWRGTELLDLQLRTALNGVDASTGGADPRPRWVLDQLSSDAAWQQTDTGWQLDIGDLAFKRGLDAWRAGGLSLRSEKGPEGTGLRGAGRFLRMQDIATGLALLRELPIRETAEVAQWIGRLKPAGDLVGWSFDYAPKNDSVGSISARATVSGLGLAAFDGVPGFSGLDGHLQMHNNQGSLRLGSGQLRFDAPELFRTPLELTELSGELDFAFDDAGWSLSTPRLWAASADLRSASRLSLSQRFGEPLMLDMQSDFRDGNGANASVYYPVGIMPPELVNWLDSAILDGRVRDGTLLFRGAAADFPFRDHSGQFTVDFNVENARLAFHPEWPEITRLNTHVLFQQEGLSIRAHEGRIAGGDIQVAVANIPDLDNAELTVGGGVVAPLPNMIEFAADGPLADKLSAFFAGAEGEGGADLSLHVMVPIVGDDAERVSGAIRFAGNRLKQPRFALELDDVQGVVEFTERGLSFDQLTAIYDGRQVSAKARGVERGEGRRLTRVEVEGPARLSQVLRRYGIEQYSYFAGESDWRLRIDLSPPEAAGELGAVDLLASSDLVGTRVTLPAPLSKSADTRRPSRFAIRVAGEKAGEQWRFASGDVVDGEIGFARGGAAVRRADLRFGGAMPRESSGDGIRLYGNLPELEAGAWRDLLKLGEGSGESGGGGEVRAALPLLLDLFINDLALAAAHFHDVRLVANGDRNARRGRFSSREASGRFEQPLVAVERSPLVVVLDELDLQALFGEQVETAAKEGAGAGEAGERLDPRRLPPLSVDVARLHWKQRTLHDVFLRTQPTSSGLRVRELGFDNGAIALSGTGSWRYSPRGGVDWARESQAGQAVHRSDLKLAFRASNLGRGLDRLGIAGALGEGSGNGQVDLLWYDALYSPDLDSLIGGADFQLENGRILAVDPGVGRIFGLFALQALPRRLTLDFRDLLRSGLEFDAINGRLVMGGGSADTRLLRLEGPVGVIDVTGQTNYLNQTYDQRVVVLPHVSSALPLLGLLTGGVTTGLTALLTDGLLKGMGVNLDEIGRREYHLGGSWDVPEVEEIVQQRAEIEDNDINR